MKSLIKTARMVVLSGLFIFFGANLLFIPTQEGFAQKTIQVNPSKTDEAQDTTAQETYVSEVVLRAPWAEKNLFYDNEESPPGEFGVYQYVVPESLKEKVDA
jgi:hypothetical protein